VILEIFCASRFRLKFFSLDNDIISISLPPVPPVIKKDPDMFSFLPLAYILQGNLNTRASVESANEKKLSKLDHASQVKVDGEEEDR
jgi:hypothetical protein